MPDDPKPQAEPDEVHLAEPTDRRTVELGESHRKGTGLFPVVNMAPEDVQPSVAPDSPPGTEPPLAQDE